MNRRLFVSTIAAASLAAARSAIADDPAVKAGKPQRPLAERVCLFTDHLDDFGYGYGEVAGMLKQLGIAGPDLTVRPGGLVLPEHVKDDLPKAVAAFRDAGLEVPMISTGLTSAKDKAAADTLRTAAKLGIRYYKLGYYSYGDVTRWREQFDRTREDLTGLLKLSKETGMVAGFHNHAGPTVGGALWDSWDLLSGLDPSAVGFYFDPAQATIEGGNHAWKLGLALVALRVVMVAIKDFVWEKTQGEWRTRWVPLGEGMVRWKEFFAMLKKIPFEGPLSLHIEYDPGGATRAARFENSLAAAQRDLAFLRRQLEAA